MFRRQMIGALASAALLAGLSANVFAADWVEPFPVKGKVTVVDFGAEWCASCPEMEALMKKLQKDYGDRAAFVTVDIDKYPGIDDKYLITSMPTQMFYDVHGEPIWVHTGALDEATLRERADILIDAAEKEKAEAAAKK